MNRDQSYLNDICRFAAEILRFVEPLDEVSFAADYKTQLAVLYALSIIGEATKKLSVEFREQHPTIPWKRIAGMRDKLIHDYRQVDVDIIWQVTQIDIPNLLNWIQPLLPVEESPDSSS